MSDQNVCNSNPNRFESFQAQLNAKGVRLEIYLQGHSDPSGNSLSLFSVNGGPQSGKHIAVYVWADGDFETYYPNGSMLMSDNVQRLT